MMVEFNDGKDNMERFVDDFERMDSQVSTDDVLSYRSQSYDVDHDRHEAVGLRRMTEGLSIQAVADDMHSSWSTVKSVEDPDSSKSKPREATVIAYINSVNNLITQYVTKGKPGYSKTIQMPSDPNDAIIDAAIMSRSNFDFDVLVRARRALGWTQLHIAAKAHLSDSTIASIEGNGKTTPRPESMAAYATAIITECKNRTPVDLIEISGSMRRMNSKVSVSKRNGKSNSAHELKELMGLYDPKPHLMRKGRPKRKGNTR